MANNSKRTALAVASGSRSAATSFNSSDLLPLLDRPIAYQRIFAHVCGDPIAAIFLSQAFFWSSRTQADGWFYKTQAEWFEETGLTRRHQETARKKLVSLGVLEEVRRGIPAQLFFRLDVARLAELIRAFLDKKSGGEEEDGEQSRVAQSANLKAPKSQTRMAQSANQASPKAPDNIKDTKNTPKTSTKTTATRARENAATPLVVDAFLLSQMQTVGVTERVAKQLLAENPEECRRQLEWLPMRDAKKQAAALVTSIRDAWSAPEAVLEREKAKQKAQESAKQHEQAAQKRTEDERIKAEDETRLAAEGAQIDAFFDALSVDEQERINEEARRKLGVLGNAGRAPIALMMMRRQLLRPELHLS